jgi:SAM-dependent methyltransferase
MIDTAIKLVKVIRARVNRALITPEKYLKSRSLKPLSSKYGFDRGAPVDRFYIESFIERHSSAIRGRCLEIVDPYYTRKFGGFKVTQSDVLDIIPRKTTTIHGDLRNVPAIASNTYDCVIITQTYNVIDDYEAAIRESYRVLKPGGVLLVTLPTISPCWNLKINLWRFTAASLTYVFGKYFEQGKVVVESLGNKEAAIGFWQGYAQEDLPAGVLEKTDSSFPLIIGVKATK